MEQQQQIPFNWNEMRAKDNLENVHLLMPNLSELTNATAVDNHQKCQCCPYGYHIDVDFVRYCETLANGSYLKQLKQLRRSRRRQRKSMEALLHCHEASHNAEEHRKSGPTTETNNEITNQPPPDVIRTSEALRDALREAMLDFEDTFQKSRPCSYSNQTPSIDLLTNHSTQSLPTSKNIMSMTNSLISTRSRSESNSSLNSLSTVSSFAEHVGLTGNPPLVSQQMANTMATLTHSMDSTAIPNDSALEESSNGTVNMNRSALHSIRDQMAISLKRMRELEEHVKNIPILQVKLSVLKEEKRLLLLQLKVRSAKLDQKAHDIKLDTMSLEEIGQRLDRLGAVGVTSPRSSRKFLNESCARSRSESPDSRKKLSNLLDLYPRERFDSSYDNFEGKLKDKKKSVRNIGINCSVLTRDVGISHIAAMVKSIGVGCDTAPSSFCVICKSKEDKSWRLETACPKCLSEKSTVGKEKKEGGLCLNCVERQNKILKHVGTNPQLPTTEYLEWLIAEHQSKIKSSKRAGHKNTQTTSPITYSCGTNTVPKCDRTVSVNTDLSSNDIIEVEEMTRKINNIKCKSTSDVAIQFNSMQIGENFTAKCPVPRRDVGINVDLSIKPKTIDKSVGNQSVFDVICDRCQKVNTRSVGVGSGSIKDVTCSRCSSLKTRSFGVGDSRVNDVLCPKCVSSKKTRSVGSGTWSIDAKFCEKCVGLKTTSVGVGDGNVNKTTCDSCSTRKFRSVETTTNSLVNGDILLCDACNSSISSDVSPPPLPSRIPRLTLSATELVSSSDTKKKSEQIRSHHKRINRKEMMGSQKGFVNEGFEKSSTEKGRNGHSNKGPVVNLLDSESESSESSDSESSDSPDEGSYDGVHGSIVHTCYDDESIRQGLPGAAMFQPIQDKPYTKHKLSSEMIEACNVLQENFVTPNQVTPKSLNSSLNLIQQEWFRVSSQKNADARLVEDYVDAFEDISRQLLDKVVNMADANGNTAMHYAVSHGNFGVVGVLLDSKVCDVNKQNKAGYTCIMLASLAPIKNDVDREILQRLFHIGDINTKASQHGQTALMLAVSHGRLDVVKMLVDVGADVNIQDEDGSTALMCASEHGHIDIVRLILSHPDCDATLADNDNSTALTIAMEAEHKDIGVLIYAHMNLSKGGSPHASFKCKRRGGSSHSSTPPPRTPPPPSPALSRRSTTSVP